MITLYHCDGARSFRPLWMLEEMGLDYELKMLPFPPRVFAKEYLALNPLGTIPFMVDGETKMTESSGICHYLGIKHGPTPLMVGENEPAYGAFLNWMYFSDATLTFPQTLVLRYTQLEPEERPQSAGGDRLCKMVPGAPARGRGGEPRNPRRCAPAASPRPISSSATRCASPPRSALPRILDLTSTAYWDRLRQREAYQKAVAAEQQAGVCAEDRAKGTGVIKTVSFRGDEPRNHSEWTGEEFELKSAPPQRSKRAARGGQPWTIGPNSSGHLMLITPERVFYAGLLGRPRERCPGAFPRLCRTARRAVADDGRRPRGLWRAGRGGAECPAHHRQRLSIRDLRHHRTRKRVRRHLRGLGAAAARGRARYLRPAHPPRL